MRNSEPRKPGRPYKSGEPRATLAVSIPVSDREWVQSEAKKRGVSQADVVIGLIHKAQ